MLTTILMTVAVVESAALVFVMLRSWRKGEEPIASARRQVRILPAARARFVGRYPEADIDQAEVISVDRTMGVAFLRFGGKDEVLPPAVKLGDIAYL